jgi:hypothetical protein
MAGQITTGYDRTECNRTKQDIIQEDMAGKNTRVHRRTEYKRTQQAIIQ